MMPRLFPFLFLLCLTIPSNHAAEFPPFRTRLGTQTFAPTYQFTSETKLQETADAIWAMGSDCIKFIMNKDWSGPSQGLPANPAIQTLVDLARDEPTYRALFDGPFQDYLLWVYPFQASNWHDGLSEAEAKREYQQVYDLAAYFLQTYNGSGKSFYFGHWEGDWWLLGNYDPKKDPSDAAVQGMIDWLAIRQKAVETARTTIAHENVQVWHYVEVNLVKKAMEGGKTITNNVLPNVTVDLVSYSAYDTIFDRSGGPAQLFLQALDTIESKARTTGHFPRDVFVGEYGFPLDQGKRTPEEQARLSEEIYTAALQWGCPFVLYWQMYDNEAEANGVNARGFWLIDAKNEKQPIYYKHRDFLSKAQIFIQLHRYWLGRNPSEAAYSAFCGNYKTFSASKTLDTILDSEEYQRRLSNADYLSWLWAHLFPTRDRDSAEYRDWLAMLDNGEARSTVLNHVLDFSFRQEGTAQTSLVTYLLDHTQDPMPAALREKEKNALQTTLDRGASPSQLWREILDRPHGAESLLDHRASEERDARWLERHLFFDPAQLHPTPSASLGERIE